MAEELTATDRPPDLAIVAIAVTQHAPMPIAMVEGAAHLVRYANSAFCRLMDQPEEELVGTSLSELLPEGDECVMLADRVFRTGEAESQYSQTHPVFWSWTMWPVMVNERPVGIMIQVTESTEFREKTVAMNEALMLGSLRQHELAEAAEVLNEHLRTEMTKRRLVETSLVTRATELAVADRSKDEFLAMLAHELRNPLAPLRNAAEILRAANTSEDEREQAQIIIGRQIENMSRMIEDLLDVSRITEGKIELRRHPVALETVLAAATSLARPGIASRGQELTVSLPTEPIFLNADATRLEQIFNNLLGNACKYSGAGARIWLSAERSEGTQPPEVTIRVRDDGIGISPEVLPYVFDLFVQASRTLDRVHGGLGIGLTLVQRLVKLHGGSVEAHSSGLGSGSEFIVRLPILSDAPPPSSLPDSSAAPEPARRILIVDDNTDSARTLAILQRRRGHEIRTAFTGHDAVAVAAAFLPEVVLLDVGLPGMDGYEVARQLRSMPALAGVFIIAMTGYGSAEDRNTAKEAGFDEYLVKPVDLDLLRDWLRQLPNKAEATGKAR